MGRLQFDVKFRPQIESGEYKVETRDGLPARIICWDKVDGCGQYIVALVQYTPDHENMISVCEDGIYKGTYGHGYDLFIITPEPELSEWETFISGCLQKHGLLDCGASDRIAKNCSTELLDIARNELEQEWPSIIHAKSFNAGLKQGKAEASKDLPRWKNNWDNLRSYKDISGLQYIVLNGKAMNVSDLKKLPGFKED